jgi:hypothetical protein
MVAGYHAPYREGINPRYGWVQDEFTGRDRLLDRDHLAGVGS